MILLAVIGRASGVKGDVKVKTFTQEPENLFKYGALFDEKGHQYTVRLVRVISHDQLVLHIEGVEDRTQAEALNGTKLFVQREQLPVLQGEEFYQNDLIGLPVQDLDGKALGHVTSISNYGAGDFLEIKGLDGHVYTAPLTHEAVPHIHISKDKDGFVKVDPQFLLGSE
jgi:16S rRNA processing protein RimM